MAVRVVVVGLGPGGPDLITAGTQEAIERIPHRYLRTARHPAAGVLPDASSFDSVYEIAASLEEVYHEIVVALAGAAAEHGEVLYAVPGSPVVAERTVEMLVARSRLDDVLEVEIVPAMSFLDLAWARLRVDPVAVGARVVDGQRFAVEAAGERGPLLVAQCDSPLVLSDIKLALDAGFESSLPPGAQVTVLHHLGLPDERLYDIGWLEVDRIVDVDHLTSLYIPELAVPIAREVQQFVELVATLRLECPWDREQTHDSLTRHLLEETYEVLEAIDGLDVESGRGYEHLEEELGDLLFQIVFHATLAAEEGWFTLADVTREVHDKLRLRHPHVFGDVEVAGPADVMRNWEQIKKHEKGRASVFEGIPTHLPALLYALKVQKKAASLAEAGLPIEPATDLSELSSRALASGGDVDAALVGDLLDAVVDLARRAGIDPEAALRATTMARRDAARVAEGGCTTNDGSPPSPQLR